MTIDLNPDKNRLDRIEFLLEELHKNVACILSFVCAIEDAMDEKWTVNFSMTRNEEDKKVQEPEN